MADMFDVTDADTPYTSDQSSGGSGNTSPDFWRNLMNFGLQTMAAGSQPGATTLGALGKGGVAAMDSARQNAQMRMQQQLYGSETAKNNLSNQMQLMGMNAYRQYNGQSPMSLGPNGQIVQGPMQQDNTQNIPSSSPSSITQSGGNQPQESSGMAGPVWGNTAGNARLNTNPPTNAYPRQTVSPFDPPVPGIDPDVWRATVVNLRNINPDQAKINSENLIKMATAGPIAEAEATARGKHPGVIDARQGGISYAPDAGITVTGRLSGESSSGAGYLTPPSITGPGNVPSSPQSGGQYPVSPVGNQQAVNAPGAQATLENAVSGIPVSGNAPNNNGINWPAPVKNPANPFGIKSGETLTSLPEYVNKWRDENYPRMANLQTQMQQQTAIDDSLDKLKNASMLQPGTWASERLNIVNAINTAQSAMGVTDPKYLMSQESGADAAEFIKSAQQNTNASAHEISSRGTNFDIQSAAKANPQYTMPYMAALITNSMNGEAVARNYNRIKYIDDRLNNGVSEAQATQEFEQQQPGDLVVKRAESIITPVKANAININKLLPGTKYVLPDGKTTGYIPIPSDYPFLVPYSNPLYKKMQGSQ